MELIILNKIKEDPKMYEYLHNHSFWYRELNRSVDNYASFEKSFKEYKRLQSMEKVNSTIENIELLSNLIKFVD